MNNCTILATTSTSWHGFPAIELPEDKRHLSRKSIAIYYYTEKPPSDDTDLNRSTVYVSEPFPSRFQEGTELNEKELIDLRELWQMRANLNKELLEEICPQDYNALYLLQPGDRLNREQTEQLRLFYAKAEETSDYLQKIHLTMRNPQNENEASEASSLRMKIHLRSFIARLAKEQADESTLIDQGDWNDPNIALAERGQEAHPEQPMPIEKRCVAQPIPIRRLATGFNPSRRA